MSNNIPSVLGTILRHIALAFIACVTVFAMVVVAFFMGTIKAIAQAGRKSG